jgi:hypothetical protein
VAQLLLFWSFVLRARIALGRMPVPYEPDPKALGFDVHHGLVWLAAAASSCSPALWLAIAGLLLALGRGSRRALLPSGAAVTVAWLAWRLYHRLDPGDLATWFLD